MTSQALHLGPGLDLPFDAVTETFAILAKRGSGKTYTAKVIVEEMLAAGLPVCVLDPLGVWWGLRSSEDGTAAGEPVVIFGGDHADVPLEHTAGELIADLVVDDRVAAVLDLSGMSKAQSRRFVTDFAERLYRRNRDPLHLVVDEADAFAPQRTFAEGARCLGAMEDLVRRGRARGIGVTLITQRPAVLNKDVLTQAEVLVAMRMTGPRDVAAIDEWVRLHADEGEAAEVKASLPALPIGTAWVWSPGWLGILQKVAIRRARTFDSSATPKAGQRRVEPKRMASVDLEALGERIAATVERAKADDPRTLRSRIAQLEREAAATPTPPQPVRVEVPVVADDLIEQLDELQVRFSKTVGQLAGLLAAASIKPQISATASRPTPSPRVPARAQQVLVKPEPAVTEPTGDVHLKAGARRILLTLARHHPMRVTRSQLGTLAKFKVTGGTFQTYWSVLKRHGLVDESGGAIGITEAGLEQVGAQVLEPLTTADLLAQWRSALKAGARNMLDHLVALYPEAVSRDVLAEAVEMTVTGGTFQTYLSTLRRNGLVDIVGNEVSASESLFLGSAA